MIPPNQRNTFFFANKLDQKVWRSDGVTNRSLLGISTGKVGGVNQDEFFSHRLRGIHNLLVRMIRRHKEPQTCSTLLNGRVKNGLNINAAFIKLS